MQEGTAQAVPSLCWCAEICRDLMVKIQGQLSADPGFVNLLQRQRSIDQRDRIVAVQGVGVRAGDNRIRSSRTGLICRGAIASSDVVIVFDSRNRAGEGWERSADRRRGVIGLDGQIGRAHV